MNIPIFKNLLYVKFKIIEEKIDGNICDKTSITFNCRIYVVGIWVFIVRLFSY